MHLVKGLKHLTCSSSNINNPALFTQYFVSREGEECQNTLTSSFFNGLCVVGLDYISFKL